MSLPEKTQQQAADQNAAKRHAAAAAADHAVAYLSPIDQAYIAICLVAEAQG